MATIDRKVIDYLRSDPVLREYGALFSRLPLQDAAHVVSGMYGLTRIDYEDTGITFVHTDIDPRNHRIANSPLLLLLGLLSTRDDPATVSVALTEIPGKKYDGESRMTDYALRSLSVIGGGLDVELDFAGKDGHDLKDGLEGLAVSNIVAERAGEIFTYESR